MFTNASDHGLAIGDGEHGRLEAEEVLELRLYEVQDLLLVFFRLH